jgi:hypothetical protein
MRKVSWLFAISIAVLAWTARPSAAQVRIYESQHDDAISEGDTVIPAAADAAYATAANFFEWRTMFPDIKQVIVTKQDGDDARVTLIHTGGNRDNLHFHNRPGSRTVWFEDTGGRATVWAEITFSPGSSANLTRVHSRIYADVKGFASLFVSDSKIRNLRRQRIFDDLTHLRAYFVKAAEVASVP